MDGTPLACVIWSLPGDLSCHITVFMLLRCLAPGLYLVVVLFAALSAQPTRSSLAGLSDAAIFSFMAPPERSQHVPASASASASASDP
jgi:hypothetical protein